ncbi:hydrolase Cof [Paenibacillus ihbetae]|uniref:Hydrolase Cof n=1 Tax=Paenibacillus ihbetae TaxID=1870820 RepID=A0A1B2E727_9BACL|nr:Cof-type HAD-IIB family hydrolase [Paenibacillus ihbetae]ANY75785.1 hydrolase Cof [Paenibacillus ihbetae]
MNKKLIFFDIDGTLLDHDKRVPESTLESIQQLKDNGHEVAIATGRAPYHFQDIRELLGIDSYVSLNGQYVVHEGKPIYGNPLPPEQLQQLTELAVQLDHPIIYAGSDAMKMNVTHHKFIDSSWGELKLTIPEYDPEYYLGRDIYQAIVFCTEEEEGAYRSGFEGRLDLVRWGPYGTDVLPAGGSKAEGIRQFIQALGMEIADTIAFGDYLNDLEMLSYVGHGVAMGNAPDIVKRAARHVTKDVSEDGIRHGLQMLGLLDPKPQVMA